MATFGQDLKQQREDRGFTLEALAAETRVNPRHLQALEQNDFAALPGGVFRQGILRAYLGAIGLAESDWMPRFRETLEEFAARPGALATSADQAWATFATNVKRNRQQPTASVPVRWVSLFALLLAVLAAGVILWRHWLRLANTP